MRTLFAKEVRALAPLMVLCFAAISGDFLVRPFTERLDEASWSSIASIEPGTGPLAFVLALLACFVAYAAFPREHDEGTLAYLESLPVTRPRIFAAKVVAGLGVLATFVALGEVTNGLLQLPNPQSFSGHQWDLGTAARLVLVRTAFASVLYAHVLLASCLRRFGLLPLAIAWIAITAVTEAVPSLAWIAPQEIVRLEYHGSTLRVPWRTIAIHAGAALVSLGLAYAAWMGPLARLQAWLEPRTDRSPLAHVAIAVGTVLTIVAGITALVLTSGDDESSRAQEAPHVTWGTATITTSHYAFSYPTSARDRALALASDADATFGALQTLLGAGDPGVVSVDLGEESSDHEGLAGGQRIRIGVLSDPDPGRSRFVLAHETAHVLEGRESRNRLRVRFFVEGSAEWAAHEVVGEASAEPRRWSRLVAAAAWERFELDLADVADEDALHARFDTSLVYSLGETWTEAVARACGRGAVGDLMRAIGRDDAPDDLTAVATLEAGLQSIGCADASVRRAWETLLAEVLATEREQIDRLPRTGVVLDEQGNAIATLDRPAPAGARWMLRIRRDRSTPDTELYAVPGVPDQGDATRISFVLPHSFVGERVEVLCVTPAPSQWPLCEEWH